MEVDRTGIHLGVANFSFYGIIIIAAVLAGGYFMRREALRRGQDPATVVDLMVRMFVAAVVLARLFFIWNPPPSVAGYYDRAWYLDHPFDLQVGMLALWSGGLSTAGALAGAVTAGAYALWRRKLDMRQWMDILAPGVLIFWIIAPWANVVTAQLVGPPTRLPWGIVLLSPPAPYNDPVIYPPLATGFHPTPAYLSLWALASMGITWYATRRWSERLASGDRFTLSAGLLLTGLFPSDFIRIDVYRGLLGLSGLQGLVLVLIAGLMALRTGLVGRARPEQVTVQT